MLSYVAYIDLYSKPMDAFVNLISQYTKDHTYMLKINAPTGSLTFGVGSGFAADKTDHFTTKPLIIW
jgi:hypothetical protein